MGLIAEAELLSKRLSTGGLENLRGEAHLTIAGHSDDGYELILSYDIG